LGVLLFIIGILQIVGGLGATFLGGGTAVSAAGVLGVVVGLVNLALAWGALKGWGWVWTLTIVWMVINIIVALLGLVGVAVGVGTGVGVIGGILLPILVILYMNTQGVRSWFGKNKRMGLPKARRA